MSVACRLDFEVHRLFDAPDDTCLWDKMDPYIKLTLHDGEFDKGGAHVGESVRTTTKNNAGGTVTFGEKFTINKPENMDVIRIELWDSNVTVDELIGSIDLDLDKVHQDSGSYAIRKTLELVKGGKSQGKVEIQVHMAT